MVDKRGNYELYKHGFKSDKEEAYTAQISIRIPPTFKERLVKIPDWRNRVRELIFEFVEEEESDCPPDSGKVNRPSQ